MEFNDYAWELWDEREAKRLILMHWWDYRTFLVARIKRLETQNDEQRRKGVSYKERLKVTNRIAFGLTEIVRADAKLKEIRERRLITNDLVLKGEEGIASRKGMEWYIKNTYQKLPVDWGLSDSPSLLDLTVLDKT